MSTDLIEGERLDLPVASAEDIILAKLHRSEASEQQWRDIVGVVRTQGSTLDLEYLRRWAAELNLGDLLDRALDH